MYRQIDGYRYAPLGTLYRPKYVYGGVAIHGYTSVKVTTGDEAKEHTRAMIVRFEAMKAEIDLKREKLIYERQSCDFPF